GGADPREAGGLTVDPTTHAAHYGDASVALTPTEYRLLGLLVGRAGETVRRRELIQAGWPHGAIVNENTLDAYLARLRRKLRRPPRLSMYQCGSSPAPLRLSRLGSVNNSTEPPLHWRRPMSVPETLERPAWTRCRWCTTGSGWGRWWQPSPSSPTTTPPEPHW